jgi:glycosyltransferase involved in cell wall biosynthesis
VFLAHLCFVQHPVALALAIPWLLIPLVTLWRSRHSPSLADVPDTIAADAPSVTLVIPARNEEHNLERCIGSIMASTYPRLRVIAVDDHSTDATPQILAALASRNPRLEVITPDTLPPGWFGKQWACESGARVATGEILGFMDADTWQSPDMIARIVNTIRETNADFLSVAGTQVLGSFWEKLVQPQVFSILLTRYGGPARVNASRVATDRIANGQCIFVRRAVHESLGGHAAVRDKVAEDLALAQLYFLRGKRALLVLGLDQLSTRMYTSFAELSRGWGKNLYGGGLQAWPGGRFFRLLFPPAMLLPGAMGFIPPILALLGVYGVIHGGIAWWGAAVTLLNLLWWSLVYAVIGESPLYALLSPLGSAAFFWISLRSLLGGKHVQWKERTYTLGDPTTN